MGPRAPLSSGKKKKKLSNGKKREGRGVVYKQRNLGLIKFLPPDEKKESCAERERTITNIFIVDEKKGFYRREEGRK